MANIAAELAAIMAAVYGEEVRGSIHDAIDKINTASEKAISSGSAFAPGYPATGYPSGSLYLNTTSNKLLRSNGAVWEDAGSIKGNGITKIEKGASVGLADAYTITFDNGEKFIYAITNGNGIVSIIKTGTTGLEDTYTITYDNGLTSTFKVTNGENGNKWYRGTVISGKSINPTIFSSSGIANAHTNDFYMNPTEGAVYHCVTGGAPNVATWSYDFTMEGGGSGGASSWADLTDKPFTFVDTDDNLQITGSGESKRLKLNIPNKVDTFQAHDSDFDDIVAAAEEGDFIVNLDEEGGGGSSISIDGVTITKNTNNEIQVAEAITDNIGIQLAATCSGVNATLTNATYIGTNYLLEEYIDNPNAYVKSRTISGSTLTLEFSDTVTSCVVIATKKGV